MVSRLRMSVLCLLVSAAPLMGSSPEGYDSGKAKILSFMTNDTTGVGACNKNKIKCAESQNLVKDLNTEQIAASMGCKTLMGKTFFEETLKYPVSPEDKKYVLERQNIIKTLVDNPDFKQEIEQLLEVARQQEQEVTILMSELFKGQTCPELASLELVKKQNSPMYPFLKCMFFNPSAKLFTTSFSLVSLPLTAYSTTKMAKLTYQLAATGQPSARLGLATAYLSLITSASAYGMYKDYSTAAEKRTKMHALNQLVTIAEKIEQRCIDFNLKNNFNLSSIQDAEGVALIEGLKHSRYTHKNTKLFMTPLVHTFLYKIYEQDNYLGKLFACIAEMDAYNALATKLIESKDTPNKFCFTTFVEDEKPVINATGFWNVLVQNPVTNSLYEGKNIILTGPNKGGKTTSIRSLLQNILLGHTFGVAAAERFEFTMFDVIHSYLNISDDLINGLSLFASELKRAEEVLERIKALEPQKKFFFALDELFTGTVSEDGEKCAYEFIKRIMSFKNIQFIYATHFNELKKLGTKNQLCINYKADAPTKNAENKLVYPFTLSQGASDSRVALDLAREANLFA